MLGIFTNDDSGSPQSEHDFKTKQVTFSNKSESYCISFVDIIGSSQITSTLSRPGGVKNFYAVFINEIANIVKNYGGKILKTVGDGVIFYFPETRNLENEQAFQDAIECLLKMISSRSQ